MFLKNGENGISARCVRKDLEDMQDQNIVSNTNLLRKILGGKPIKVEKGKKFIIKAMMGVRVKMEIKKDFYVVWHDGPCEIIVL